jgi:hypothetical protein
VWRDHGLPWAVHEMTNEQYLMIATHKLLDSLEENKTPYRRTTKKEEENFAAQIENIRNLSKQIKEQNEKETENTEVAKEDDISSKFDWKKQLMDKVKENNADQPI